MAISPSILLFLSLLLGVSMLGMLDWSHRRGLRIRLRGLMGADAHAVTFGDTLQRFGRRLPGVSDEALRLALMSAGYFQPEATAVYSGLRLLGVAAAFGLVLLLRGAASAMLPLFAGFLCWRFFPIFLKLRAEGRARALRAELPPVIDVLLMVLQSGVSIDQCLRHAGTMLERTAPLTAQILRRYAADIDSGMPYEQAFERLGQRLGIEEGHDLAAIARQALLQGGEILVPLERFGAEIAEKRLAGAREQIGRKSLYLTVVMLAFFMPVLLVILAGPAVSTILDTLSVVKQQIHHREMKR